MTDTMAAISYQERIQALRRTKIEHTREKLRRRGTLDIDDHGWVPWDEPIPFTPMPNHPDGKAYGIRAIGEHFRAWLQVHPVYIHPHSALAGAWVQVGIPGVGGWPEEARADHLQPIFEKYNVLMPGIGGMNHIGPDMQIGLDLGWGGLLAKLRRYHKLNQPTDPAFYEGEEAFVEGVQVWIGQHAHDARQLAAQTADPQIRENLLQIAQMNEWLVEGPPRTFREACQFLAWFQSVDRMWAAGGGLGQIDELLRPFYEADVAAGRLCDEEAVWCLASLFFNDTHYSQIGGPATDGHDLTCPVSFMVLEAMHQLHIPINMALRVHDDLDPSLLHQAVTNLFADGTGVSYACAKGLDEGFARNGYPIQLARMRAKVGCNWTALPGVEYCLQDVTRQCLVAPFQHAFNDVIRHEQSSGEAPTMDRLWTRYLHHLAVGVDALKRGKDWHMEHHSRYTAEIVLNLFMHGTVERGLDVAEGGVDIYNLTVDGLGTATVADSFAAIEQRIVHESRMSWQELAEQLENDWENAEDIRLMMKSIARFGTGGSRADYWALRISEAYSDLVRSTPTPNGFRLLPGLFSHGTVNHFGAKLSATPNGRRSGDPISHNANPDPGFLPGGGGAPTAKSTAVAMVQPRWGNTTPLQLDLDSSLAHTIGGIDSVIALIKAHNELGGTLINLNVISKEQLLEAHEDPEAHPDLVVRVTGYSAYFRSLSKEYRQQVVNRILAESA
ncbi:MAG: pyruvate-formate lyase [Gemmatimonadetes bacterium]|jgi:formate C-acetyltransferase|nr:pyruvate-formate lyase [Gemmatimonadota bacterium]MBT4610623.1 pyruvate-formate lyase [Gemmatimonadota bacterium]MBT5144362.1 pyruvate-formate lyase [Gemmatimonadota bacterium]MBT5587120.1 pyruvate-formate lyase [Gemmatimonadota bacterium]MBT5960388.1 pyruvate-formate lyase [Gemmatimonadota bacterium]